MQAQCRQYGLEEQVELIGWIPASGKGDFYNSVDVMCFTSEWDVQPLVILESFAYAKPLIGTDIDGPSSMYTHGETAYVVPPQDAPALARAIVTLRDDVSLRQSLAVIGRAKALREHSDSSIAQQLEMFCSSLIAEK